jgi:hypothetical protein
VKEGRIERFRKSLSAFGGSEVRKINMLESAAVAANGLLLCYHIAGALAVPDNVTIVRLAPYASGPSGTSQYSGLMHGSNLTLPCEDLRNHAVGFVKSE